jgi:bifunctional polynucleotide phosphatase/kinase
VQKQLEYKVTEKPQEIIIGKPGAESTLTKDRPVEIIVLVGSPGAGKSTFWQTYLQDYFRINNDTLKTPANCIKATRENILAGKSCVIDNTNPTADVRARYTTIAKDLKVPIRCIYFLTDKQRAMHNDSMRADKELRKHLSGKVGKIPIHTFYKNSTLPTLSEGFEEVMQANFVEKFESSDEAKSYYKTFFA